MTRSNARIIGASMLAVGVLLLCALPLVAQENNTYIQHAVRFGVSPALRDLAKLPQPPQYGLHEAPKFGASPNAPSDQSWTGWNRARCRLEWNLLHRR